MVRLGFEGTVNKRLRKQGKRDGLHERLPLPVAVTVTGDVKVEVNQVDWGVPPVYDPNAASEVVGGGGGRSDERWQHNS